MVRCWLNWLGREESVRKGEDIDGWRGRTCALLGGSDLPMESFTVLIHCLWNHSLYSSTLDLQVADFVRESGLIRGKPLKLEDIRSILESLVYDARLEVATVRC